MHMKKVLKRIGLVVIMAFNLLLIFIILRFLWYFPSYYLHLDFSQNFRKVEGYEDIVFTCNDSAYSRTFWGLSKNAIDVTGLEKEQHESDEIYEKLRSLVGNDYYIDQYVLSPDEDRILYEEMHPWGAGAPTDDEDIYFKVVDLNDGSIVTLFKGPQQFFDIYWK